VTRSTKKLPVTRYEVNGQYPVVDQGAEDIGGFTDDTSLVHPGPLPAVVFGDHTRCVKFLTRPFVQGADGVKVLAPALGVSPKYAYWVLRAASVPSRGYARHFALLRTLEFPLAPWPEQHRIISAIESYFTRLDDAVANLERVQRNLRRYRASVLKAAVEGRLVPTEVQLARTEGRDYEPASILLERILRERRRRLLESGRQDKYREPVALDTDELPELPEGWCWASLDQLASLVRNGYSKAPTASEGVPILRISAVRRMQVDAADVRFLPLAQDEYQDFLLDEGDLLFTRYNGNPDLVGVCGVLRTAVVPLLHPDKLIRVRLVGPMAQPDFVEIAVNIGTSRRHLESLVRTTAGQAGISGSDLKRMPVPLPPEREQARISTEVARLLSLANTGVERETRICSRLRQSILKWAFEGKLADQDPTDEPASVLLERNRAEKSACDSNVRKGSRRRRTP
jgi:type I restriction enzyme S subunit